MSKENEIARVVVDRALQVHRTLGPGLLERVYEAALEVELRESGLAVARQVPIAVAYRGQQLDEGFRADMVVDKLVLLELKSLENLNNAHRKQVQTYLRLSGLRLGLLLNFGADLMRRGTFRFVNGLPDDD